MKRRIKLPDMENARESLSFEIVQKIRSLKVRLSREEVQSTSSGSWCRLTTFRHNGEGEADASLESELPLIIYGKA